MTATKDLYYVITRTYTGTYYYFPVPASDPMYLRWSNQIGENILELKWHVPQHLKRQHEIHGSCRSFDSYEDAMEEICYRVGEWSTDAREMKNSPGKRHVLRHVFEDSELEAGANVELLGTVGRARGPRDLCERGVYRWWNIVKWTCEVRGGG
ncbi:hypothetical protein BU23DRAFT_556465 [Bimuria novae-zelandiae CBS 107.79]|uniref:Uncharacterized protein n=1 Tax=Bimuria novae-zelandiae CBS 107.79 TaxID=1447943 RepID=A0A6A5VBY3_9PLEO|nr:hypothetical protein BU23DRAFT_556465 [Bimuria novae-zelandiae CBS 107.79]